MKTSHYDILQVSPKALPAVIEAAYQNLKPVFASAAGSGDQEARNQLLFLEEAYSVLSSPERRRAYDANMASETLPASSRPITSAPYSYQGDNAVIGRWSDTMAGKFLLATAVFMALFAAYKFQGKHGEQKIQEKQLEIQEGKEFGTLRNDTQHVENERLLVQGVVQNQNKAIDRSYDVATREAERRRAELEYRADAGAKALELQQQRLDAQLQQQRWAQEQYEKERRLRDERAAADAPKRQLCSMYAVSGKVQEARAAGCYSR
ncbi:MAG: DnaJ domain-containing protein [Bacteroidota bacterium]